MKSIGVFLWASLAIGTVLSVVAQVHSDATPAVLIRRRKPGDMYGTTLSQQTCNDDNATYLVQENHCISNHHLFNGKLCGYLRWI